MTEQREPYRTDPLAPVKKLAAEINLHEIRAEARARLRPQAEAAEAARKELVYQLDHAESVSCEKGRRIEELEAEDAELRRALLALVVGIEMKTKTFGQNSIVYLPDIELQLRDARELLAKMGLL